MRKQRPIHFRAWNEQQHEYINFEKDQKNEFEYEIVFNQYKKSGVVVRRFLGEFDGYIDCVLEQSTGVFDKEGVEIFEGDIVENGQGFSHVEWVAEYGGFNPFVEMSDYTYSGNFKFLKIIGNIHKK